MYVLTRAIGNFQRSLISQNSPFDEWYYNKNDNAISNGAKRGFELFDKKLHCTACHALPAFTNYTYQTNKYRGQSNDMGRFRISRNVDDQYTFRVPSLRNVTLTSPYMHDGGITNLENVLTHYDSLYQDSTFRDMLSFDTTIPTNISAQHRNDLLLFLNSLVDTSYMYRFR